MVKEPDKQLEQYQEEQNRYKRFLKLVFPIVVGVIGNVVLQAPVPDVKGA